MINFRLVKINFYYVSFASNLLEILQNTERDVVEKSRQTFLFPSFFSLRLVSRLNVASKKIFFTSHMQHLANIKNKVIQMNIERRNCRAAKYQSQCIAVALGVVSWTRDKPEKEKKTVSLSLETKQQCGLCFVLLFQKSVRDFFILVHAQQRFSLHDPSIYLIIHKTMTKIVFLSFHFTLVKVHNIFHLKR